MENHLSKSFKVCATCERWGGERKVNPTRTHAIYDTNTRGECYGGCFNRLKMSPMSTCNEYKSWCVLK
jgi:hypothetical protein